MDHHKHFKLNLSNPKCSWISNRICVLFSFGFSCSSWFWCLVAVCKATHAAHHAEHVVVDRIDAHLGSASRAHRVDTDRELQGRLVDTGEVAGAAGLVLLRLEREGIHVDTLSRGARVVLVGLDAGEVASLTLREAVLAVELELGNLNRVLALATNTGLEDDLREQVVGRVLKHDRLVVTARTKVGVEPRGAVERGTSLDAKTREVGARRTIAGRCRSRQSNTANTTQRAAGEDVHHDALRAEVIRVVEGLASVDLRDERLEGRAVHERIALDDPHKLLNRVVEVELDLVGRARDRLGTRELELLNQVLVRLLGEPATLLRVEVDVVDVERGGRERLDACGHCRGSSNKLIVGAVDPLLELHVDAHLVVLERDERDRKTRVAAEPELERDVQRARGGAGTGGAGVRELGARAGRIKRIATTILHQHEVVRVADHVVERLRGAHILGELGPDLHPVTILTVNALTADLELNRLDETVTDVVEPAEAVQCAHGRKVNRRENNLDVCAIHQIGVTVDHGRNTLVEVGLAVERHLNGLHREVRVTLVEHLPERDLGVARDVDILRTIADELKKTTTHIDCLNKSKKNYLQARATHLRSFETHQGGTRLCSGIGCLLYV